MIAKNRRSAIAWHLGWDYADVGEYYYQESTWSQKIVSVGNEYYTAQREAREPKITNIHGGIWPLKWHLVDTIDGWNVFRTQAE
jgi:hypothetical protein